MPDRRTVAAVFAGGAVGTLARALLSTAFPVTPPHWPWPTFAVNVVGAFLLGWITTRLPPASYGRSLLGTGLCGGLTTFSTMQVEILAMLADRRTGLALGFAAASVAAGYAAVRGATALARRC
jgi:fluoride exporter